ncbi:MAG TPA: DPP IV N-terminal domain-containing protein, partial [Thermoanaerobaculia bacterium]|nr:DPP IV N-terminal domain-containing protein [Thermoanaerobaculia bacterium]
MKTLLRLALSFLTATALLASPGATAQAAAPQATAVQKAPAQEATRKVKQYTIEQFLANTAYSGNSFSPDSKKVLISSNQTGVFNIFAVPVDGGKPAQLTDSKVSAVFGIGYFPKDERFLYGSDQGGNEQTHLYVQSPDGKVQDLTPGEKVKADFQGWTTDDKGFFFSTNERDPAAFDLYEMSFDGFQRKLLYKNEGGYILGGISPDRRYLALVKIQTSTDSDIYLYDRTTDKVTLLT